MDETTASTVQLLGAGGFGFIIGWLTYYSNRWRQGEVKFSDLATLIGIIGGGAVLGLFPQATDLFGAYGIGLFLGFFLYFLFMVGWVANSDEHGWSWFLDGRSKQPPYDYFFPGGAKTPLGGSMGSPDKPPAPPGAPIGGDPTITT
jgi:hypothetical protein